MVSEGEDVNTVRHVLKEVKKMGIRCTERTFWHYHKLRLLPDGAKISGRGNIVFFPNDVVIRLWLINVLIRDLEFTISDLCRYPWPQLNTSSVTVAPRELPGEMILASRQKLQDARDACLRHVVGNIESLLKVDKNAVAAVAAKSAIPMRSSGSSEVREKVMPKSSQHESRENLIADSIDDAMAENDERDTKLKDENRLERASMLGDSKGG